MKNWIGQWLLISLLMSWAAEVAAGAVGSRYDRTIRALQMAEPEWRADFAGIALWQLAGAYYAEADLARQDMQQRTGTSGTDTALQKKRHWSATVDQYAGRLSVQQQRVEHGAVIALTLSPVTEAVLDVEGEQVMLAHPRPEQQKAYEQAVLEQFCQLRDCGALTGWSEFAESSGLPASADGAISALGGHPSMRSSPVSATVETLKPSWEFTASGSACTYGGIRLRFQPNDNLGALRKLCLDVFGEVAVLRDGLLQQQQYGVDIDWSALEFSQRADEAGGHMLKLNRTGDWMRLHAPVLRDKPALLHALRPWLSAQLSQSSITVELQAEIYGWRGAALDRYR